MNYAAGFTAVTTFVLFMLWAGVMFFFLSKAEFSQTKKEEYTYVALAALWAILTLFFGVSLAMGG